MLQFFRAYQALLGPGGEFVQPPVAQLANAASAQLPRAHNMPLLQVVKMQIDTAAHERQGAAVTAQKGPCSN